MVVDKTSDFFFSKKLNSVSSIEVNSEAFKVTYKGLVISYSAIKHSRKKNGLSMTAHERSL